MANLSNINNKFLVTTGGNVGIGNTSPTLSTLTVGIGSTNSPSQICQLAGSGSGVYSVLSLTNTNGIAADNNGVGLDFHVNAAYSATGRIQLIHPTAQSGTTTNSSMQFLTYGTVSGVTTFSPRMTIDYIGNVGIGTTLPVSKFEVDGSIKVTGITSNIGATAGLSLSYDSGINYINTWASTPLITSTYNYQAFHISGSEKMRIHTNGGVELAGDLSVGGANKARFKSDGTNTYVDAIPANSEIRFRVAGAVEKFRIAASGATTQTMDSTTSLSHLWSQGVPLQNVWYTVYTYSQYDSVCFFAMVSFENDAGDGANQSAMFATGAGAAYGAAFAVEQISGGTGIEARRSSTSFQVRQTIGGYTASTRLNVRFVSIN